ncbi:DUF3114 domain-containing protein [Streptococcus suis]|uniref:DUF3114 domain-containing protein n=1 Tax=Streptococcus suis TaxID=1307 RepID=UPI001ABDB284|nr:DUF3114 domain-containing protein [Streptococcus suis]
MTYWFIYLCMFVILLWIVYKLMLKEPSDKQQEDVQLENSDPVLQELSQMGWSQFAIARVKGDIRSEEAGLFASSSFHRLCLAQWQGTRKEKQKHLAFFLSFLNFPENWKGSEKEATALLDKISKETPPHHPFWKDFSGFVAECFMDESLGGLWKELHQLRYLIAVQQADWVRRQYGKNGQSDRDALVSYLRNLKKDAYDLDESARLHNKFFLTENDRRVHHFSPNLKILIYFHSEFILSSEGHFLLIGDGQFDKNGTVNGASFNYASRNDRLHWLLDITPVRKFDPDFRRKMLKTKAGRYIAPSLFPRKKFVISFKNWATHYKNPRGLSSVNGVSKYRQVQGEIKKLKCQLKSG